MRISDWSSDVCSSDLDEIGGVLITQRQIHPRFDGFALFPAAQIFEETLRRADEHLALRAVFDTPTVAALAPLLQASPAERRPALRLARRPDPVPLRSEGRRAGEESVSQC